MFSRIFENGYMPLNFDFPWGWFNQSSQCVFFNNFNELKEPCKRIDVFSSSKGEKDHSEDWSDTKHASFIQGKKGRKWVSQWTTKIEYITYLSLKYTMQK